MPRNPKPPFFPLEYDYRSHRPVQTLIKLVGRPAGLLCRP
jgi:hypothetical protein